MNVYAGLILITALTVIFNITESSRKFALEKNVNILSNPHDVKVFYDVLNFNVTFGLGVIGLACDGRIPVLVILVMIALISFGVMSKAAFSDHKPDRMSCRDRDVLWGLMIPNACGFSTAIILLLAHDYISKATVQQVTK